jgi:transcriptional regulator with PAS, ATPase and Fis domain
MPVYCSATMERVLESAARAARNSSKVLITGESGVGKDIVARFIHARSPRASRAFVAVNCAGFSETLLESELFGHVRGSFTGAYRDKPGKLQVAHGGTIFLDEVGEMTPRMQALLLRFLESGEVQQVGADHASRGVDARVITATNRDLGKMTASGHFREDLLYRIRVVEIQIPPLRQRPADIPALIDHFLRKHGGADHVLTDDARVALERYHWPGNVRELQNTIEQVVSMAPCTRIGVEDLPAHFRTASVGFPHVERRRQPVDELYTTLVEGKTKFWDDVYPRFMDRDMTRNDLRCLISRGLAATNGSYRDLLALFHLDTRDYKRLLNFLARHDCSVDFRRFRVPAN